MKRLPKKSTSSFALVLVLLVLVLICVVIVSFLGEVQSERVVSHSVAEGGSIQLLKTSTLNIVEAQIKQATASLDSSGNSLSWASQPGMIRAYNTSGNLTYAYKLYSSTNFLTTQPLADATNFTSGSGATWYRSPAYYTDLNAPFVETTGDTIYPIADATQINRSSWGGGSDFTVTGAPTAPIGSAVTNALPMPMTWLYVLKNGDIVPPKNAPNGTTYSTTAYFTSDNSTNNPIIGRIAFWTDDETCKVNINTASEGVYWDVPHVYGISDTNYAACQPAQGEFQRYPGHPAMTSLLTALPFLDPSSSSVTNFTTNLPGANYNNAYTISPRVGIGTQSQTVGVGSWQGTQIPPATAAGVPPGIPWKGNPLYDSVDELAFDHSVITTTNSTYAAHYPRVPWSFSNTSLSQTNINQNRFFITASSRAPEVNLFSQPRIMMWPISTDLTGTGNLTNGYFTPLDELIAFCGTSHSITNSITASTNYYFFQRTHPISTYSDVYPNEDPSVDWSASGHFSTNAAQTARNQQLFGYLQSLTSNNIPGFGGNFLAKYPSTNTAVANIPTDRDQILTEIIDYIRSENTFDGSLASESTSTYGAGFVPHPYTAGSNTTIPVTWNNGGNGEVAPLFVTNTTYAPQLPTGVTYRGFGRFPIADSGGLIIFAAGRGPITNTATAIPATSGDSYTSPAAGAPAITNAAGAFTNVADAGYTPPAPIGNNVQVQAIFNVGFTLPSTGFPLPYGNFWVEVRGLDGFTLATSNSTNNMGMPSEGINLINPINSLGASRLLSGVMDMRFPMYNAYPDTPVSPNVASKFFSTNGCLPFDDPNYAAGAIQGSYGHQTVSAFPFYSVPINVPIGSRITISNPNPITVTVWSHGTEGFGTTDGSMHGPVAGSPVAVQKFTMYWPSGNQALVVNAPDYAPDFEPYMNTSNPNFSSGCLYIGSHKAADRFYALQGNQNTYLGGVCNQFFVKEDRAAAMVLNPAPYTTNYSSPECDARLLCVPPTPATAATNATYPPPSWFVPSQGWTCATNLPPNPSAWIVATPWAIGGAWNPGVTGPTLGYLATNSVTANFHNVAPQGLISAQTSTHVAGDWDTGIGIYPDGPYVNKPDEGALGDLASSGNIAVGDVYFGDQNNAEQQTTSTFFSPNREVPSAGMFGSLPTGVIRGLPWQTLLFRPGPVTGSANAPHPGAGTPNSFNPPYTVPPDHLFLDFFTMPVVEPYAISELYSTSGKINLNYQIVPFAYMRRDTGIRALLRSEKILAIAQGNAYWYKAQTYPVSSNPTQYEFRYPLNLSEINGSLRPFEAKFASGDIFRCGSQICDVNLVPMGQSWTSDTAADSFWSSPNFNTSGIMTGDNERERPYTDLYGRVTTKSNTYTIHYRVQTLQQTKTDQGLAQWQEGTDVVTGESRGFMTIERFLDYNTPNIPDYAWPGNPVNQAVYPSGVLPPLDSFYKFRTLLSKTWQY